MKVQKLKKKLILIQKKINKLNKNSVKRSEGRFYFSTDKISIVKYELVKLLFNR